MKVIGRDGLEKNGIAAIKSSRADIIPFEFNLIEFPIFVGKGLKKLEFTYFQAKSEDSFMHIKSNSDLGIPGEFEQRVFVALLRLMKENSYEEKFIVSISEILFSLGEKNKSYYSRIKKSLKVLSETIYTFKNCFYSYKERGILREEIRFSLINIRPIMRDESTINSIKQFEDKRKKEVYEISIAEKIYENIASKGFLAIDFEKLSNLDNLSKNLYIILEKKRINDIIVVRPIKMIAEKICLSVKKKNILRTFDIVENALKKLKEENLIKSFFIQENSNHEKVELIVNYDESHNIVKQKNLREENNFRNKIGFNMIEPQDKRVDFENNDINTLLKFYPEGYQNLQSLSKILSDAVKKWGYEYVRNTVEYVNFKNPKNYTIYTQIALEENWAEEYGLRKELKKVKKENTKTEQYEQAKELIPKKEVLTFDDFSYLTNKEEKEIEERAYKKFIKKIDNVDNSFNRKIFEKAKKGCISEELYLMLKDGIIKECISEGKYGMELIRA